MGNADYRRRPAPGPGPPKRPPPLGRGTQDAARGVDTLPAMQELGGKHIVLGLTGGIACYKSAELCRLLVKAGATVQVVMTEAATQFITPVTMQALSGRPVYGSQWDGREPNNMPHINLSREADAIVLAPCQRRFHRAPGAGPLRRTAEPHVPGAPDRPRAPADGARP